MKLFSCCVVLAFFVIVNGNISECDDVKKIKTVTCNNIDMKKTTAPCELKKGTNASLSVVFKADSDISSLKSVCHGIIGVVPIPFNDIQSNSCVGMKPSCPLKSGNTYTFTTNIFVKTSYPSMSLGIKWEVIDTKKGKDEWCLVIPAKIV